MAYDKCHKCKETGPHVSLHNSDDFFCTSCANYNDDCLKKKVMPDWKTFLAQRRQSHRHGGARPRTGITNDRQTWALTPPAVASPENTRQEINQDSPIINELLCFVSNKVSSMPYDMLSKLCTDFYKEEDISCARDILFNITEDQHQRRRVNHRGNDKKHRNMLDIINVFLELALHSIPTFVCKDISNLPPLSMNNFDMASIIKSVETLQIQVQMLTENQIKSVDSQVKLSTHLAQSRQKLPTSADLESTSGGSGSSSLPVEETAGAASLNSVSEQHKHHSIFSDDNHRSDGDSSNSDYSDPEEDSDLIRLASIQNRNRVQRGQGKTPHGRHERSTRYESDVITGSGPPSSLRVHNNDKISMANKDEVIVGSGSSSHIRAANFDNGSSQRENTRHSRTRVGLFLSRVARSMRRHDIDKHVEDAARIKVHSEEISPKYGNSKFRSFFIRINARDQHKLFKADMWPKGTLVKGYYE